MTTETDHPAFALGTFSVAGCPPFPGLLIDGRVIAVEALRPLCRRLGAALPAVTSMVDLLGEWDAALAALQAVAGPLRQGSDALARAVLDHSVPLTALRVHAPVAPRQVFCCGANYFKHVVDLIVDQGAGRNPDTEGMNEEQLRAHAQTLMQRRREQGTPYFFSKPSSAVIGPFDAIPTAAHARQVDWEIELAVIVGRAGHHIPREHALEHVAGYSIANDISNRDHIYRRDDMKALGTDWIASKSQPGYLPLGPWLVPSACIGDPAALQLTLQLNGQTMQDESAADMIFDIARQIEYLSSMVQLLPGDVICTGSPAGNGTHYNRYLRPGDTVVSRISGLGAQINPMHPPLA